MSAKWLKTLSMAFLTVALPASAQACSVCFGDPDSDMTKGLNAGVLALLAVVAIVLSGFAAFFVFVARRSGLAPAANGAGSNQLSSDVSNSQ